MHGARLIASTFLLGGVHALAFAPWPAWWLQVICLGLALRLLLARRPDGSRHATRAAFAFAMGHFVVGLCWLHISMHIHGGLPWLLAALAVLAFGAYLSIYPTIAIALAIRWRPASATTRRRDDVLFAAGFAALWALAELARGWVMTGFPWLSSGYAHVDGPLGLLAPWIGVYGVGAASAWISAWLALSLREGQAKALPIAVMALSLLMPLGLQPIRFTEPDGPPVTVRLVQGNVPQQMKFDPQRSLQAMGRYTELVGQSRAQLTVLPETAWTTPWTSTPDGIRDRILSHLRSSGGALAVGLPMSRIEDGALRYTNSVMLLDKGATADRGELRYDKHHLVPFGEFIPWGFDWFVRMMRIPLGSFASGTLDQAAFDVAGRRFAFNICYEDLFGEEIVVAVREPVSAGVLVNVSNLAWFGDSHALPQHLEIARMRALETARPMLRATNTGVTAHIDERARVLARLPQNTEGSLDVAVQATRGLTPYVRSGNLPVIAFGASLAALVWWRTRRAPPIQ